jgi:hypothetical protein
MDKQVPGLCRDLGLRINHVAVIRHSIYVGGRTICAVARLDNIRATHTVHARAVRQRNVFGHVHRQM